MLLRSPELQASFVQLLDEQQNPDSTNYHKWLTPQEVGERYGPTQHDVAAGVANLRLKGRDVLQGMFNTIIPTTGVDPGVTGNGDQGEATLDVQRVIGTASGAQVDLVVSGSAGGYNGIYVAAQYEVQTLLDPVMNISFGAARPSTGRQA